MTGLGVVSPLGHDAKSTFEGMCAGRSAIAPVTLFDATGHRSGIAAEVLGLTLTDIAPVAATEAWSRADALAVAAARSALLDAGLGADGATVRGAKGSTSSEALGISVGATAAGLFESESALLDAPGAVSAELSRAFLSRPLSDVAGRVRSTLAPNGPSATVCCACSSGAAALVQGAAWIRAGRCDRVLAGGVDALCRLTFAGFNALCALDTDPCRPFDASRNGLSLGEGSAFLVLESEESARARGARVLAWFAGWGIGSEAHHITRPEPSGETAARLLRSALQSAGLDAADVAYVNAHGTGTLHNDAMEALALRNVFGERTSTLPVSSSKGSIGHTLGAAGAIEAAMTVLTIDSGFIPASVGCSDVDGELALDVPSITLQRPVPAALSSSFGFGGAGCVLAFTAASSPPPNAHQPPVAERVVVTDWVRTQTSPSEDLADAIRQHDAALRGKTRRFDRRAQTAVLGALGLANQAPDAAAAAVEAADTGLVLGTAYGSLQRTLVFLSDLSTKGPRRVSPAEFPHLLPSAAGGNTSVALGLRGPVFTVLDGPNTSEAALDVAIGSVLLGLAPRMIAGAAQTHDATVDLGLRGEPASGADGASARSAEQAEQEEGAWIRFETESDAIARGVPLHAWISVVLATDCDDNEDVAGKLVRSLSVQALPSPRSAERSVVLASGESGALGARCMLECSSWRSVSIRSLPFDTGTGEAAGVRLVAFALDLLARGEVDEALVCTRGSGKCFIGHLGAMSPPTRRLGMPRLASSGDGAPGAREG